MKISVILIFLLAASCISTARADDAVMPPPPKGYTWAKCPEIKGAFLRPTGWHFKKGKRGDTLGIFITKEKIDRKGQFTTGLSINVIPGIPKKKSMTPYKFARQFRESARKSSTFTKEWDKDLGPFKSVGFVYDKKDKAGSYTVHNLLIANNKTGTLYLVMFEGPSAEWPETWKTGEPMLQYLYIDDEV